jgi:hypothetical protein
MPVVIEPPAHVQEWALWLAAVVAGLTAVGWLWSRLVRAARRVRRWWRAAERRFDALEALVQHELNPNTGTSMKDALGRVEAAQHKHLQEAAEAFSSINGRLAVLEAVGTTQAEAQAHLWPAIEAVAKATPPPDPGPEWPEDDNL